MPSKLRRKLCLVLQYTPLNKLAYDKHSVRQHNTRTHPSAGERLAFQAGKNAKLQFYSRHVTHLEVDLVPVVDMDVEPPDLVPKLSFAGLMIHTETPRLEQIL